MQRIEVQHHTSEQVRGYLDEARVIVEELQLPEAVRVIAYGKAVDLLASKTVQATATPVGLLTPGIGH